MAENSEQRQGASKATVPEERLVAARALYEGTPGMTLKVLSVETGIPKGQLEYRAKAEGWKKNYQATQLGPMSDRAQDAADRYGAKVADAGPEITPEQKTEAVLETVAEVAVDQRAQVIDRHRREWAAPRKLSYEAVQSRDFEKAKLAKITAETLQIIQANERKAWGIEQGDGDSNVFVIERG